MRYVRKAIRKRTVRNKPCMFCVQKLEPDYKDVELLKKFISDRGKIIPRGSTGICQKHQRRFAIAIKRGRFLALLPFIVRPA